VDDPVHGLDDVPESVHVFHAGTRLQDGQVVTAAGRVLTLVGVEREAVYRAAETIHFNGKRFRHDIGVETTPALAAAR
jgi:phosphoribosylamine--glycine ligase